MIALISTKSKRGKLGAKRVDTSALSAMLTQQQMTTSLGVVRKFEGETSHFDIDTENGTNEILVDVELIPSGTRTQCRLGFGNDGVYRIPRVGTEVAVLLPYDPSSLIKDSLDYEGIIVGCLNVNSPSALTGDNVVFVEAEKVVILSDSVKIGTTDPNPLDEVVVGTGIDPFSGATYKVLGNTAAALKVKK